MRFDVPKLADYSGAVQANQSMMNAFKGLSDQSQDYLKLEEQKKQNEWNKAFEADKFKLETDKYKNSLQEKADVKSANIGVIKTLYPTEYGNLSNTMGENPHLLGNVDIGNIQAYNTNISKATQDKRDFDYRANQDNIQNNFERDRIAIQRQNAGKPSELDRIMGVLGLNALSNKGIADANMNTSNNIADGNTGMPIQKDNNVPPKSLMTQNSDNQTNILPPQNEPMPLSVGQANQKYGAGDYLTKGIEKTLEENGNTYSYNPITGTKMLIKKAPEKEVLATQKLKNELEDEKITIEGTIKNNDKFIKQVDGLIKNKNLDYATGILAPLSLIPATDAKGIAAEIEVIKGGAFLSGIEALKGTGALSDSEGKKVTDAIANLDRTQSASQLRKQLGYIKDTLTIARENAIEKLENRGVNYQDNKQIDNNSNNKSWKDYQ